jgi:hypothetical protein
MVDPQWEAYQIGAARCIGLDLKRSQYIDDFGNYSANSSATFYAGQLVSLNASQEIILCTGSDVFGVSKYNKATGQYATVVGEYIQLTGTTATNLAHANLFAGGGTGTVRVAAALTGGAYTEGAGSDYVVNYVNGTVTRSAGSTIPSGGYVYVNYQYALSSTDLTREGANFWLQQDDVTIQDNRITVITGRSTLFTSWYDPAVTYTVNATLYSGATADNLDGYFTTKVTSGVTVGTVFQLPTADDPYLGVTFTG